mmetsp:Transcript_93625/g.238402  ORF Transcript_93625/g.238402 Transcript_93625/m.238402 type:complete len:190 (+) Transcript_93625:84-653(+)
MAARGSLAPDVLGRLRAYLEDEEFLKEISCWAWVYCVKFPYESPNKWEHPLEFTRFHAEYRELFEGRCDEFLEQEGVDLKAILDEVATELQERPGEMRGLVDSLAASEDYLKFCKYMQQIRMRRDWAEGKDFQFPSSDDAEESHAEDSSLGGDDGSRGAQGSGLRPSGSLEQVLEEDEEGKGDGVSNMD